MTKLAQVIILAGAVVLGWYGREWIEPGDPLELEMAANQTICADGTPAGYASYVVSHWGELRGCLRVKLDSPAWATSQNMFVRKVRP